MENKGQSYGYVRVSTIGQNEARQLDALRKHEVPESHIYVEKQSGKDFERPIYRQLLKKLKPGDVLYITSIDRLGRNYDEILQQWWFLTKQKQIDIVVMEMPLLDTRHDKNLLGSFIADLVLQILSFVAQSERESICERQRQGIESAKKRGVRFGRPELPSPEDFPATIDRYRNGEITLEQALMQAKMSRTTFYRRMKRYNTTTYRF